jgi:hypothetical protein
MQELSPFSGLLAFHQSHRPRAQEPTQEVQALDALVQADDLEVAEDLWGGKEGGREGGKEGGREGGREQGRKGEESP